MNSFSYAKPKTIDEAVALIQAAGQNDVRLLAGGTDLLVRLKNGHYHPDLVVDLKAVQEFDDAIRVDGDKVIIGALTRLSRIELSDLMQTHFPALVQAVATIGSIQIRNRATLAGNICNASPAADSLPPLLIYDARMHLMGPETDRTLPLASFILGPGKTALASGELLHSIILPIPKSAQSASFERLTRRRGVDLATINLCCQAFASGLIRFAVGAAAPVPFIVEEPEGLLADPAIPEAKKEQIIAALMTAASPITDVRASKEYRMAMIHVLAKRAMQKAIRQLNQVKDNSDRK